MFRVPRRRRRRLFRPPATPTAGPASTAVLLNTEQIGIEALKLFGQELFASNELGFDPPMAGPVPPDYVLGPGDSIRVQMYGNVNGIYEFEVSRDGVLSLPEIGPVTVSGLPFSEFRKDLKDRVAVHGVKVDAARPRLQPHGLVVGEF